MDSFSPSSHSCSSRSQESPSFSSCPDESRRTAHARDRGGLVYGVGVAWTHLRPFLPFILISCLVVALVYLLQAIVYSGPFSDPLFFQKFNQRWPKPVLQQSPVEPSDPDANVTH